MSVQNSLYRLLKYQQKLPMDPHNSRLKVLGLLKYRKYLPSACCDAKAGSMHVCGFLGEIRQELGGTNFEARLNEHGI